MSDRQPDAPDGRFEAPGRWFEPPAGQPGAPGFAEAGDVPVDFMAEVARFERMLLERALRASRHNRRETARALGLGYHQLRRLLKKHALA